MAIALSVIFMIMSLLFIPTNGFLSAFFVILSAVAFMNHTGGNGDDDQRVA